MKKADAMRMVNDHIGGRVLEHSNTSFANINARSPVWWFTFSPQRFRNELHILLAKNPGLIWLRLDAGAVPDPESAFTARSDKRLIDFKIAISGDRYLRDIMGKAGYDFRAHVACEWDEDPAGEAQGSGIRMGGRRDGAGGADGEARDGMPAGRRAVSQGQVIVISPTKTTVFNPGDPIPPIIELDEAAADLAGGPVFEGTDVPVAYAFYYMDKVHNLHAFLDDFPQVSRGQAVEAIRARVKANDVVHSDREIVSGTPVFRGTRVFVRSLFEHLESGYTIDAFLRQFPTTEREQVVKALQAASALLESVAYETSAR